MRKNRYLLCLLVCGFLLYAAVPRLNIAAAGAEGIFSITWLVFALFVIAGNLTGILYYPKKQIQRKSSLHSSKQGSKSRSFH